MIAWPDDLRGRAAGVVFACFVCQLGLGYMYLFGPLLPEVTSDLGWTRAPFAAARWFYFGILGGGLALVGHLTARVGERAVLVGATALISVSFLLLARVSELWQLYAANALFGVSMVGLGDVVIAGILTSWLREGRGLGFGLAFAASNVAGLFLPRAFAALTDAGDWRSALVTLAFVGPALILPFAWLAGGASPARAEARDSLGAGAALELGAAMRTRSFWILLGGLSAYFFFFVGMNDAFVATFLDAGMTRGDAAALYSLAVGAGGLSKIGVGLVANRIAPRRALAIDFGLLAASSFLLFFLPAQPFLALFLVSYGLGVAARDVVFPLVVGEVFGERTVPRIYGALSVSLMFAGPLGSQLTQAIYDRTGSYESSYSLYAIATLAMLGSLAWVRREVGRERGAGAAS